MKSTRTERTKEGRFFRFLFSVFLFLSVSLAVAETVSTSDTAKFHPNAELDQVLAPVALYPDALLLQVLRAATFPIEVSEAVRWLKANPDVTEKTLSKAVDNARWDGSVKALLAFEDVLFHMASDMDWTVRLGSAFERQPEAVMDRIQYLRRKARAAGNLASDERMNVIRKDGVIVIEPVSPEIIYVPYYRPAIVYGSWWWPAHAPCSWQPWRGYACYPGHYPCGFMWGGGTRFSWSRFYGRPDWQHRRIHWSQPPLHHRPSYGGRGRQRQK